MPPICINSMVPNSVRQLLNSAVWLLDDGSMTIAEDSPICVLIISPADSIASMSSRAVYPIIAPQVMLRIISKNNDVPLGTGGGFSRGVSIVVKININPSFTYVITSLLWKTGANRTKPARRAKTTTPAKK